MHHGKVLLVIWQIMQGKAQKEIAADADLSWKGVHSILQRVLAIAVWANDNDYQDAAGTFERAQVDETVVSKRKYNTGKRTRQAGAQWMEVEVKAAQERSPERYSCPAGVRERCPCPIGPDI